MAVDQQKKVCRKKQRVFNQLSEDIEVAIGKFNNWKKRLERIKEKAYAIKRNSDCYDLDDHRVSSALREVENLEQNLNSAVEQLKFEDDKRCVYSLSNSRTASIKLPVFHGDDHEDFSKFKKEMEKGMRINHVRRYAQVAKLRECLRELSKKLIPETMEDINEAWNILSDAFGDPTKVMAARKWKLSDLSPFPATGKMQML